MSNKTSKNAAAAAQPAATLTLTPSSTKLPADIVIEIFKKLPAAATLGRLRCVCKSWRARLSDRAFLRRILVADGDRDGSRQIMIFRLTGDQKPLFSPCSYDTLLPLSADPPQPVLLISTAGEDMRCNKCHVVGYDNGIFCLGDGIDDPGGFHLHNPATSETKALPPSPFTTTEYSGGSCGHMFGFDSKANDYKLIRLRKVIYNHAWKRVEDGRNDEGVSFAEVYSLRNDSWSKVETDVNLYWFCLYTATSALESHDGKCYRWDRQDCNEERKRTRVLSFDLAKEAFEVVEVLDPLAEKRPADWYKVTRPRHVTFWRGSMVAVFDGGRMMPVGAMLEIWVMLKFGEAGSWVKLYDVPRGSDGRDYYRSRPLGLWKEWKCVFVKKKDEEEKRSVRGGEVLAFDPETWDVAGLEVRTDSEEIRVVWDYVPNRVSLLGFSDAK
ncbi:unnamed protein product [Linum tenue]|uniref:F-box domain-containing protein n=1 Tax=Linum tenue TaxID=586396 RepID=A0AAV0JSC0_9ROSI|nr:unnamed protein product [Linum tenue]